MKVLSIGRVPLDTVFLGSVQQKALAPVLASLSSCPCAGSDT